MATGSFQFGTGSTSGGLFGAKSTSSITFGSQPATQSTSGFSFGAKTTAQSTSAFSLGAQSATLATSGFSFGAPASSTGTSLFGPKSATTTASTSVFSFPKPTTTASAFGGFGKTTTTSSLSFGGFGKTTTASTGFGLGTVGFGSTAVSATAASTTAATKPAGNPKDEEIPKELAALVSELETYIKKQKDVKDEITKTSSQEINMLREEMASLSQAVALISNRLQRDFVAVQNLKGEVGQELKNAEIAQRLKDVSVGLHHDYALPMEYFQRLVYSFETRISTYRMEIEELETFLSTSSNTDCLTPQNLLDAMKHLNESFVGLASDLQDVHECVKIIKEKYLQYRRIICNDSTNPFASRKSSQNRKGRMESIGPSPFPVVQGAGIMMSAIKPETKASTVTGFSTQSGFGTSFGKPVLTRSLSAGGKSTGFGSTPALSSGSLFGKSTAFGTTSGFGESTRNTPAFTLQKPPGGKRGKLF